MSAPLHVEEAFEELAWFGSRADPRASTFGSRADPRASTFGSRADPRASTSSTELLLTCEHASQRLPAPWSWSAADGRLVGTHWAYDLGARELTLELATALCAPAVCSRFTRLLVDPNRPEAHPDLFRAQAEREPVELNRALDSEEQERRLARYYRPFHAAVDAALSRSRARVLLSIHTFTPLYEGRPRHVALGVLFNREEERAYALGAALEREFTDVAYNEPWSGKDGLIFSAESHAERAGAAPLELEVRQDLAVDPFFRRRLVEVLARYFG